MVITARILIEMHARTLGGNVVDMDEKDNIDNHTIPLIMNADNNLYGRESS